MYPFWFNQENRKHVKIFVHTGNVGEDIGLVEETQFQLWTIVIVSYCSFFPRLKEVVSS